ncbi:putative bifunctional diguanylate cyclase/phosphodiesterase [Altererythrobacter aquiaggeris]|uniref:putative bifunctional diguanylate cyclase/phosphodiesterase n=1 Tax=Aestuarierythrobacter aquiaggeris TaxID=1898396 RepID=UPI0030169BAB
MAQVGLDLKAVDLALAKQLSKRMPFVYAIAIVNLLLVADAFYGTVSDLHLLLITVPLLIIAIARAMHWHPHFVARRSPEKIARDLAVLPVTGTAVAACLMVFGLSLYPFGDTQQQSLIHYIATLTSFIGILGLNPSPKTALGMTLVSVVPSITMFLYLGHPNAWAISATMVCVSLLLLLIARTQHAGLIDLIRSKNALQFREIEAARLNDRLHTQAYVDDLTGIANRRSFLESFETHLTRRRDEAPWLGLIDLDGFKTVNDLLGHLAGDEVLKAVAKRLTDFPNVISCGRLGGDEFGFLLSGSLSRPEAVDRAEKLAKLIAKPIPLEPQLLTVKASIGLRKTAGLSTHECIERADWALYKAKQDGGKVTIFSADDEVVMHERARITQLFDSADLANQLEVVYQPIMDFDSGEIQSVEVLARWNSVDGFIIMPDVFIPMAESTHRTSELTKIIVAKSISELPEAFRQLSLHINLSAKDITNTDFVDWLLASDAFHTFPRTQVLLELTETAILSGGELATGNLTRLRAGGFRIALDDFGVGQSSLSRIHKLPLDQIKIDKSFCQDASSSDHGWAIVATILALSRQIGLECVLEGVETEAQALQARSLGVRLMQGYHFSKPQGAAYFRDMASPVDKPDPRDAANPGMT